MALVSQDLLGKLQAQATYNSHDQVALILGNPEANIMTLRVPTKRRMTSLQSHRDATTGTYISFQDCLEYEF